MMAGFLRCTCGYATKDTVLTSGYLLRVISWISSSLIQARQDVDLLQVRMSLICANRE